MARNTTTARFVLKGEDKTKAAFASAKHELDSFKRSVFSVSGAIAGLGIGIAGVQISKNLVGASIELQRIHYSLAAATGSAQGANAAFKYLAQTSLKYGQDLRTIAPAFARFAISARGAGENAATMRHQFEGLLTAFTVLHTSAENVSGILVQLDQSFSKGKVQMRDLYAISQHLPGVFSLVDEGLSAMGLSMQALLAKGGIPIKLFIEGFTNAVRNKYLPELAEAMRSLNAEVNRLKTTFFLSETQAGKQGFLAEITRAVRELTAVIGSAQFQAALGYVGRWLGEAALGGVRVFEALANVARAFGLAGNAAGTAGGDFASLAEIVYALGEAAAFVEAGFKSLGAVLAGFAAQDTVALNGMKAVDFLNPLGAGIKMIRNMAVSAGQLKTIWESVGATIKQNTAEYQAYAAEVARLRARAGKGGAHAPAELPTIDFKNIPVLTGAAARTAAGATKAAAALAKEGAAVQALIGNLSASADPLRKFHALQLQLDAALAAGAIDAQTYARDMHAVGAAAGAVRTDALAQEAQQVNALVHSLTAAQDPLQQFHAAQLQLDIAFADGAIDAATYARETAALGAAAARSAAQANDGLQKLMASLQQGLTFGLARAFEGLAEGTMSLSEAWHTLENAVIGALARMAAQALAAKIIGSIFNVSPDLGANSGKLEIASGVLATGSLFLGLNAQKLQKAAETLLAADVVSIAGSFAIGGYTGAGGVYQIAGAVHAGEYVQPQYRMAEPGALAFMSDFHREGMRAIAHWTPGYAGGGAVAALPRAARALPFLGGGNAAAPARPAEINQRIVVGLDDSALDAWAASSGFESAVKVVIKNNPSYLRQTVRAA